MKLKVGKVILAVAMLVAILVTSVVPVVYAQILATDLYDDEKEMGVAIIGYTTQENLAEAAWGIKSGKGQVVTTGVTKDVVARTSGIPYKKASEKIDMGVQNMVYKDEFVFADIIDDTFTSMTFEPAKYIITEVYTFSNYSFSTTGVSKTASTSDEAVVEVKEALKSEALSKLGIVTSDSVELSADNLLVSLADETEITGDSETNSCTVLSDVSVVVNGTITVTTRKELTELPERYSQIVVLEDKAYANNKDYKIIVDKKESDGTHTVTEVTANPNKIAEEERFGSFYTMTKDISGNTSFYLVMKTVRSGSMTDHAISDSNAEVPESNESNNNINQDMFSYTDDTSSTSEYLYLPRVTDPYHDDIVFKQIEEPSTDEAKMALANAVEDNEFKPIAFLNIEVDGGIPEVDNAIKFRVAVPSDIGENVTYKVLRYHDGKVDVLDTTIENGFIVFESDKFSDYQLVYTDKVESENPDSDVDTADYANVSLFIVIAVISALAVLGIVIREKTFKEEN